MLRSQPRRERRERLALVLLDARPEEVQVPRVLDEVPPALFEPLRYGPQVGAQLRDLLGVSGDR